MTDEQIISRIDFIHESGCGRGGFKVSLPASMYDDNIILDELSGEYINPIGPFRKWVELYAKVTTEDCCYFLAYRTEFRRSCSEWEFTEKYLEPFLDLLRKVVSGQVQVADVRKIFPECSASREALSEEEKMYFPGWVDRLKNNKMY